MTIDQQKNAKTNKQTCEHAQIQQARDKYIFCWTKKKERCNLLWEYRSREKGRKGKNYASVLFKGQSSDSIILWNIYI